MDLSQRTIEDFHDDIVEWRKQGIGLRTIALKLLNERGFEVHFNVINRYCKKQQIPLTAPPEPRLAVNPSADSGTNQASLFDPRPPNKPPATQPPEPKRSKIQKEPTRSRANSANTHKNRGVRDPSPAQKAVGTTNTETPLPASPTPFPLNLAPVSVLTHPPTLQARTHVHATDSQAVPPAPPPVVPVPSPAPPPKAVAPPMPKAPPVAWKYPPHLFTPLPKVPFWTPDLELLNFGNQSDKWELQDACEGTLILGAPGSGKTSGSGRALAEAFMDAEFGGLVLTVKADEARTWEAYAKKMGREKQLCVIRPGGPYRLNFLDYESRRPGKGAGMIENLVALFYTILEVGTNGHNDSHMSEYWTKAGKALVRNTFRVLTLATNHLSLAEAATFIVQSPHRVGRGKGSSPAGPWFTHCLDAATAVAAGTDYERVMDEARQYWLESFYDLNPDTRSCVVEIFTSMADVFIEPAIHDLFCTETTITPEAAMDGAIIILDLPLLDGYSQVGIFAQSIWKYLFQKAVERRNDAADSTRRPVFLWIDEAQCFYSDYDGLFQTTARSARCASVYLTQNIANLYGIGGGSNAHHKVDGFLGSLNTKIMHCNNDHTSNIWAAEQIGKSIKPRFSSGSSTSPGKGIRDIIFPSRNHSDSMQETIDYEVQPSEFLNMRTGADRCKYKVDAYFVKGGATFSTGKHYFKTVFQQEQAQ